MKYPVEHSPCAQPLLAPVETTIQTSRFSVLLSYRSQIYGIFLCGIFCLASGCEEASLENLVGGQTEVFSFDTIEVTYPNTLRDGAVADRYFGYPVSDPYRWLESDTSAQVRKWVVAQQNTTTNYIDEVPFRVAIAKRLQELQTYRRAGLPSFHGEHYYYLYNKGSWAEDVLARSIGLKDSITVVLNPNSWDVGTNYRLGHYAFSLDGRYLAYEQQAKNGQHSIIRVVDLEERTSLPDSLQVEGLTTLDWYGDGFFYTTFPKGPPSAPRLFHRLYFHRLGTAQRTDDLVFTDYRDPERRITAYTDTASQCLVLEVRGNGMGNAVYFRSLKSDDPSFTPIEESLDYRFEWAGGTADHLYFVTDYRANQGKLLKVSIEQPAPGFWEEHIPQGEDEMLGSWRMGNHWIVKYLRDATHNVVLYDSLGERVRRMHLPEPGSFTGLSAGKSPSELFFGVSSFFRPETVYRLDLERYRSALVYNAVPDFKGADYQLSLQWISSYDDTNLPILLLHKKSLNLAEPHPTLLIGAGKEGEPLVPNWNPTGHFLIPAALEQGMVVAVANLRGSYGFGRNWRQEGRLRQQQTRLDDLQAVAEYLREQPFVAAERLAVYGAGQGGTLVAATLNQRPDLFSVVIAENGWYDMLRYHQFRGAVPQLPVFGSSLDSLQADHLLSYSPLHNAAPSKFPATLLLSNPYNSSGVPLHSRKLAAELQYQQRGYQPTLLYTKSVDQSMEQTKADSWGVAALSFLFYQTQTVWK